MYKYFDRLETMPLEERKAYYNEKVEWLVEYAYRNCKSTKERFDQSAIQPSQIRRVDDLERIPIVRKEEIMNLQNRTPPFGGISAISLDKLERILVSPGPIFIPIAAGEYFYRAVLQALFSADIKKGDVVLNAFPTTFMAGVGFELGLKHIGAVMIPTGVGHTELQVNALYRCKASAYLGTPSFLNNIAEKAEELGYDFTRDFSLRSALVGGEIMASSIRNRLEEQKGISLTEVYGTSDTGLVAFECDKKLGMHISEQHLVEIIDPDTGRRLAPGKEGEVVITSFNASYPMIRLGTGDLALCSDEPCPCGRSSPRILKVIGRASDAVKVRGIFLIPQQIEKVFARFDEITKFQIIINRKGNRDELCCKLELKGMDIDRKALSEKLANSIRDVTRLRLDNIEFLSTGSIPEGNRTVIDERTWD